MRVLLVYQSSVVRQSSPQTRRLSLVRPTTNLQVRHNRRHLYTHALMLHLRMRVVLVFDCAFCSDMSKTRNKQKLRCRVRGLYVTQMYKHTKQQLLVSTVSNGGGCIGTGTSSLPSLLTPETPPAPLSPFNPSTTTARCPLPGFGGGYLGTAGVKPL